MNAPSPYQVILVAAWIVMADEEKSQHYAEHWGNWFKQHRPTEWHCTWDDVMGLAEPYLVHCASGDEEGGGLLVDLGCGQSQLGHAILSQGSFGFSRLDLLDIVPDVVAELREKYRENDRIDCKVGDVTKRLPYDDGEACCILDKGTLDALEGDEDKKAMLRECSRVLNTKRGVLLSISFGSVSRLKLLDEVSEKERLFGGAARRTYIIGDKDPIKGHDVRFLNVFGNGLDIIPHRPSKLTTEVLKRVEMTGSMYASVEDQDQEAMVESMREAAEAEFEAACR